MDPMVQMNEANTSSYNVAEIWSFPMNHNANSASLRDLANVSMNANQGHDPMLLDHRINNGAANLRKRADEDEAVNTMNESDSKRIKMVGSNEHRDLKQDGEVNSGKAPEEPAKPPEPPKPDYIHVRARRGQATDSHSLAERARREKISERMKILQDLVPGCNKVIGKALVLDEIINYVQSLQHQVEFLSMKLEAVNSRVHPGIEGFTSKEFLSMKLEAVNSRVHPGIEGFTSKEFGQQAFDVSSMGFGSQAARNYARGTSPEWHMQLGHGFDRTT